MSLPPTEKNADDPLASLIARCVLAREQGDEAAIERLLAKHPEDADAVRAELAALGRLQGTLHAVREAEPEQIGPYRILEVLGEGGMGTVYLAEQRQPVRRRVALKVIKLGMDTRQVLARFEAERQALAMMSHDNIAKVFEAGTTERGQPYFVMEHVPGLPLTEHCDRHRLSTKERLLLFQQVCAGVQHAHHKGVIHRDLKPSNILVTVDQGRAVPKIIDFGLARATDHRLIEATLFTQQGQIVGTPEYMSPEQAEMTTQDIDTRTDVYSLGVVLYELLVGVLPFAAADLRRAGLLEIQRRIREDEPPKPSTRLSSLGASSTETAHRRRTTTAALARALRGDLDWVVMKSVDKDRNRRYATPQALADDLERYLRHEPVLASPPSAMYRMRKFVRRYRGRVTAAAIVLVVLVAGIVGTTAGMLRAQRQAHIATLTKAFLERTLLAARPEEAHGKELTVRQVVETCIGYLETSFPDEPEVEGDLRWTYGVVYEALGRYPEARVQLERALALRRRTHGDDEKVLTILDRLGRVLGNLGDDAAAREMLGEVLAIRERTLGPDAADTLLTANNLGVAYLKADDPGAAEPLLRRAVEGRQRLFGRTNEQTINSIHNLASAYRMARRLDQAEPLFREVLGAQIASPEYGERHPVTLKTMIGLAQLLRDRGALAEAEALARRALALKIEVEGEGHPNTRKAMTTVASILEKSGPSEEAKELRRKAAGRR